MRAGRQAVHRSVGLGRRSLWTFRRFKHVGAIVFVLVALDSALLSALPYVPPVRGICRGGRSGNHRHHPATHGRAAIIDQARTEELRKRVADEVAPIYKFDSSRLPASLTSFDAVVARVVTIRGQDLPGGQGVRAHCRSTHDFGRHNDESTWQRALSPNCSRARPRRVRP